MLEQVAMTSAAIWAVIEYLKQPVLKQIKTRLNLSDYTYSLVIYALVGIIATGVVFWEPAQWDFLRESGAFGYPRVVGNILAIAAIFGGNTVAHNLMEIVKRISAVINPDPNVGTGTGE